MQAFPAARPRELVRVLALLWGPWLGLSGCRTLPPTETWVTALEAGLREPAGTFATFRAAFCADVPGLEYRCLSQAFLRELLGGQEPSQLFYREARDRLLEAEPYLSTFLANARVESVDVTGPRAATVVARAFGRTVRVSMVRVDFWEIRANGEPLDGDYVDDVHELVELAEHEGEPVLRASVPLLAAEDGRATDALEIGSEWKIAGLELVETPRQ